jgi:hypothetical protein
MLHATATVADMAGRVLRNGPEPCYATEKLSFAVFKAAEALALCEVDIATVIEDARAGHRRGLWLASDPQ